MRSDKRRRSWRGTFDDPTAEQPILTIPSAECVTCVVELTVMDSTGSSDTCSAFANSYVIVVVGFNIV